jgi:hypothetical protein
MYNISCCSKGNISLDQQHSESFLGLFFIVSAIVEALCTERERRIWSNLWHFSAPNFRLEDGCSSIKNKNTHIGDGNRKVLWHSKINLASNLKLFIKY